jgi:hypothetical protein
MTAVTELHSEDNLLSYLSAAVAGTLLMQVSQAGSSEEMEILMTNTHLVREYSLLLAKQNIDPEFLALRILAALQLIYKHESNSQHIRESLSELLWHELGDPDSGAPPEIYKNAATSVLNAFLFLLHPHFPKQ